MPPSPKKGEARLPKRTGKSKRKRPYPDLGKQVSQSMYATQRTVVELAEAIGIFPSKLSDIRNGYTMPRTKILNALAAELDNGNIIDVAKGYLRATCAFCGYAFISNPSFQRGGQRFCNTKCRMRWWNREGRQERYGSTRGRVISARKREELAKRTLEEERQKNGGAIAAIEAFCRTCEWDGVCKMPECELRDFSPLPLENHQRLTEVQAEDGTHMPSNHVKTHHGIAFVGWEEV